MMDDQNRDSDLDDSLSHNDLSEGDPDLGDADSVDGDHHISLQKIQDEDRMDRHSLPDPHRLSASSMVPPPPFSLPMPYSFPHPAYLPPSSTFSQNPPVHRTSSEGSHSSESSNSSQQTWSYEEQYKQLYELSDEPKRKEFLDDLFSFNQKKGTPINRLPIMAKSVLDLYELYNHVVQRGGLVEVINKKLWQEIIKGLNLPSSITSAAFTLRTQYMKYLYPYECHKLNLSNNSELQAAIDGNRRDQRDRRVSCSVSYSQLHAGGAGGVPTSSFGLTSPLRSVSASSPHSRNHLNGGFHHSPVVSNNNNTINPYLSPALAGMIPGLHPGLTSTELETRMAEYLHILNKQLRLTPAVSPPDDRSVSHSTSPHTGDSTPGPDLPSRLALWTNLYHSPPHAAPPPLPPQSPLVVNLPPQREALNLGKRESESSPSPAAAPPAKRPHTEKKSNGTAPLTIKQEPAEQNNNNKTVSGLSVNSGTRENSIVVSIDIGGIQYQGVLFAQSPQSLNENNKHVPVSMST
uniref:Protein dead ringer n=2 Tax=Cacopsylla melanoneura TaxID=428564 RepID=A0A8D9B311_9HEMI